MAIANKFIHFNTEAGFENYLLTGNGSGGGFLNQEGTNFETNTYSVKPEKQEEWNKFKNYTCFIKDTQKIWTHEKFYICSGGGESEIYVIPKEVLMEGSDVETRKQFVQDFIKAVADNKIILFNINEGGASQMSPVSSIGVDAEGVAFSMWQGAPAGLGDGGVMFINFYFKADGSEPMQDVVNVSMQLSNTAPKDVARVPDYGISKEVSRADHVHRLPAEIYSNAATASKLKIARNISLTGDVTGSASFDGSQAVSINATVADNSHNHDNSTITSIDASKITSGTIDIERLPKGALERLVITENQAARFQLTSDDVQEGDTVKQEDTGVMYFVVDIDNLNNESGYKVYTAGAATSVPWSGVTNKPTKLSEFTNDSGFITNSSLTEYATKEWVLQQLANYVSKTGDSTITGTLTATAFKES